MSLPSNITNPEDLKLPAAPVHRIIKKAGEGYTFTDEFKTAISCAASVFMLQTVDTASDRAKAAGRATINADDIIDTMEQLGHADFQSELREILGAYRTKKAAKAAKKANK